jgi:parallel beta-helix repeat protein
MKQNSMYRKGVVITIIFLFVGISILPATGSILLEKSTVSTLDGNTLYVGGSGPGNYSKIQDAINDSSNGDTVFVYDDSSPYFGGVVINKMINLIGENRDTTVIENGWEAIVKITADNVNVCGFTMRYGKSAVGIFIYSNYNTITGNNILENSWGIGIMNSSSNTITGNNILNTGIMDIYLWFSSNNTITNNNIMNDYWNGISLRFSSNNTITGNNITSKEAHGIHLSDSSNNTITGNNISNNRFGIELAGFSNNNIITGNTITWNNRNGIQLVGFSNYNIIYHNNFINNTQNAYDECSNTWHNGYPSCGNYWSDHTGIDNHSGSNQNITGPDGVSDAPYNISGDSNQDRYPLMEPYGMTELDMDISKILFGFSVIIKNVGETTAYNAQWKITIQGGILLIINKTVSGTIPTPILAGEQSIVKSGFIFIFGFGPIEITVIASADNAPEVSKTHPGFLLLFFVFLK